MCCNRNFDLDMVEIFIYILVRVSYKSTDYLETLIGIWSKFQMIISGLEYDLYVGFNYFILVTLFYRHLRSFCELLTMMLNWSFGIVFLFLDWWYAISMDPRSVYTFSDFSFWCFTAKVNFSLRKCMPSEYGSEFKI